MSKHSRIAGRDPASAARTPRTPDFDPAPLRRRADGWTPEKQHAFIHALAESGCVEHACQRVGMSVQSVYALRRDLRAQSFRVAWDVALEVAVQRLSDAAFSRAIHGVARPVFYQGQQIGERRHFDERLTMFILRYRDPARYGRWLDAMEAEKPFDAAAIRLARENDRVVEDAALDELGEWPAPQGFSPITVIRSGAERLDAESEAADRRREARERARAEALERRNGPGEGIEPDVP